MEDWPLTRKCTSDGDNEDVFALAATLVIWVIVQVPECHEALILYSSRLFVALLFHVVITTQQMPPEEVDNFWRACREEHRLPSKPNRFAVQVMKALLYQLRCDRVVEAMKHKRGWDMLLCADTQNYAVGLLARNVLQHKDILVSSTTAPKLAEALLLLFDRDNSYVQVLSLELFFRVMDLVVDEGKKPLEKILSQSLLPLFFYCHDENQRNAKASQETLLRVAEFLKRKKLKQLVRKEQLSKFAECLRIKQYPLRREDREGISPIIENFLQLGLLKECQSDFNTPILPVRKPDGTYRIMQDLRTVNKITEDLYPVVANPYTLLTSLTPELTWFTVLDLKDAFFCLPLHETSQKIFAFEWQNPKSGRKTQLTWTVLPQGFKNSPTLFGEQLAKDLESWEAPPGEGKMLQYVDDILIATPTEEG
ncbi:uncharacterized protein, partial [Anomalospiza imberbis]|uniref:uncharacterized protein n=1 Tax=Anomalospiza imberbis TaxID=187417 RepID=UPI00358E57B3